MMINKSNYYKEINVLIAVSLPGMSEIWSGFGKAEQKCHLLYVVKCSWVNSIQSQKMQ